MSKTHRGRGSRVTPTDVGKGGGGYMRGQGSHGGGLVRNSQMAI